MGRTIALVVLVVSLAVHLQAAADENQVTNGSAQHRDARTMQSAERQAIFAEVLRSGEARIYSESTSHSAHSWGLDLCGNVETLAIVGSVAALWPHRLGWIDALDIASSSLVESGRINELDEKLFGRDAIYGAKLWDSPSLLKNLALLSRVSESQSLYVTIYTKRADNEFLKLVARLRASHSVELRDLSELPSTTGRVAGTVVDLAGEPIRAANVNIFTRGGRHICDAGTNERGEFALDGLPHVSYRIDAAVMLPSGLNLVRLVQSEPVDAEPGDENVRMVVDTDALQESTRRP
jgi:hypothetical protein